MSSSLVPQQRKRRRYRKSVFGCRNCKLRRVKCDEIKPQCQRCQDYGVCCNYQAGVSDLQVATGANQINQRPSPTLSFPVLCTDGVASFEMDAQCMSRLELFRMRSISHFSTEMFKIWKHRIPHIAMRNPYLMHVMLATAAAYQRLQPTPEGDRSKAELYHYYQGVTLFSRKLSNPVHCSDRDPLWATAALLGMITIASFDASSLEESWPLRPSEPSDLEWFRLNDMKRIVWGLTNPLRPESVFHAMANEYAAMDVNLPSVGFNGITPALAEVCHLNAASTKDNPYFLAAHVLSRLQRLPAEEVTVIRMISFIILSQQSFVKLLLEKDPIALLLLALWYRRAADVMWWVGPRAQMEYPAIRRFLERSHHVKAPQLLMLLPDTLYSCR